MSYKKHLARWMEVGSRQRESYVHFQVLLKPELTYGREKNPDGS
jgi:hypothetical protein